MAKKRFSPCGLELPDNLYNDNRGRPNAFRYKSLDGSFKQIFKPAKEAIELANEANRLRAESSRQPGSFHWFKEKFIKWREENDPSLLRKDSWKNRKCMLNRFCDHFGKLKPKEVRKVKQFKAWWESLSYDQQHNSRAELSRFFQYLIAEEIVYINPFTKNDTVARLIEKGKPKKKRLPMTPDDFWKIYNAAGELGYEGLQLFMGYALVTDLRESDILSLTFEDNVQSDRLVLTIGKSLHQRGAVEASHHCWSFEKHPLVYELVKKSRELSIKHVRCPYLVSHKHKARRPSKTKTHSYQLLPRTAIDLFNEARVHAGVHVDVPEGRTNCTIHEIRGLSLHMAREAGNDIRELQELAAHTSIQVTKGYIAEHKPTYREVGVVFSENVIGGKL